MAKYFFFLLLAAILVETTCAFPVAGLDNSTTTQTAYEMLGQYGFPVGILPDGAQGYELRPDGSFEVHFPAECNFRVEKQYVLHYSSRIAGSIQNGSINALEGVKVKIVFAWVGIRQVNRDGEDLTFHVGLISKSFPANEFTVSPHCN